MGMTKKEYNTIDDAISSYEAALQQDTHDEPQKAKVSQLLRVAQLAKTEQESARQACQAKYVEGSELFRAENWDDAIAAFKAGIKEPNVNLVLSSSLRTAFSSFLKSYSIEMNKKKVSCINIAPGPTNTDRVKKLVKNLKEYKKTLPLGQLCNPDEIGKFVKFVVENKIKYLNGSVIYFDGNILKNFI